MSDSQKTVTSTIVLTTVVSSWLLALRLEQCGVDEDDTLQKTRRAILWLSGLAVLLVLIKALSTTLPALNKAHPVLDMLYHLLALLVVILNLAYLLNRNVPLVCKEQVCITDAIANRNLIVALTILSGVALVLLLKRGLWHASQGKKSSFWQALGPKEPVAA